MKILFSTISILSLALPMAAQAGINGTYKVLGAEVEGRRSYRFTGTVNVTDYKTCKCTLDLGDGAGLLSFTFDFSRPLKDSTRPQTVNFTSKQGSGLATFTKSEGEYRILFEYAEKGSSIRGVGSGTQEDPAKAAP